MATKTDFENATDKLRRAGLDTSVDPAGPDGGPRITIVGENGVQFVEAFGQHGQFLRYEIIHRPNGMHICAPRA